MTPSGAPSPLAADYVGQCAAHCPVAVLARNLRRSVTRERLPMTRLAASPVSWGIDFAEHHDNTPWQVVLDEIARSGLRDLELGPVGYIPAATVHTELAQRGLQALGTWLVLPLSVSRAEIEALAMAAPTIDLVCASGGTHVILIDNVGGKRAIAAGRSAVARRLAKREQSRFVGNVLRIAEMVRSVDLEITFHPHTATFVECEDEVEWLLGATEGEELRLCLDTAHMTWAGMDPAASLRGYAPALGHVHLKDLDRGRLTYAQTRGLGFWKAIAAGVFCPIGAGRELRVGRCRVGGDRLSRRGDHRARPGARERRFCVGSASRQHRTPRASLQRASHGFTPSGASKVT